jgi:hypothetical protein
MSKFNFKVSAPSLLGATFSVMTSEDGEPIIANVDEQGKWAFTVPSDMDAELLSNIQDICEGQFVPSVFAHVFEPTDFLMRHSMRLRIFLHPMSLRRQGRLSWMMFWKHC